MTNNPTRESPLGGGDREAAIDYLLAKEGIREAVNRYGRGLDRHDTELILAAYHPEAVDHHGTFHGSREELAEWGNAGHEAKFTTHSHFLMNNNVEIDGDRAGSELYVIFVLKSKTEPRAHIGGGRYLDTLERRDGRWAILERTLVLDWTFEADSTDPMGTLERYIGGTWDRNDPSYRVLDLA